MRKLLVFVALFAMVGVSHAQDTRQVGLYVDSFSGDLTETTEGKNRLFSGSCFEVGVTYNHTFENISWLRLHTRARAILASSQTPTYNSDDEYAGNKAASEGAFTANNFRARVGLQFVGPVSAFLSMDTRGLMYQNLGYNINMGNAGTIGLQQELCFWAVPKQYTGTSTDGKFDVLCTFSFNVSYAVPVAEKWTYSTAVKAQIAGQGFEHDDNARDAFRVRWENKISYAVTPKVGMWGQVRYQVNNIANPDKDVDHRVFLQAGLSYAFDVSGL